MKPKPIIFSTEMVRAILNGGKTQTRRVIKPQPGMVKIDNKDRVPVAFYDGDGWVKSKYQPGDILWVRETWGIPIRMAGEIIYRADYADKKAPLADGEKWRPSIHMPREAARIFLLVKDVWPERLQEISDRDILSEGINDLGSKGANYDYFANDVWNAINARRGYGWDTNPWVWVVEFEKTEVAK